jgi:hypothetical protein
LFKTRVFSVGIYDTSLNQGMFFSGDSLPKETLKEQQEENEERRRSLLPIQLADFPFMLERFA